MILAAGVEAARSSGSMRSRSAGYYALSPSMPDRRMMLAAAYGETFSSTEADIAATRC